MVVLEILRQDPNQMCIIQHDEVIKAFASDRSDQQPLGISVLPRRSGCGQHLCDAHAAKSFADDVPVGAVAVADEESWRLVVRERLDELLCRPKGSGVRRDVEVHNPTPVEPQDNEAVEDAERYRRHGEEVDGGDVF